MPYFRHRDLIVEAHQYNPKGPKQPPPPFLDDIIVRDRVICGKIVSGPRELIVQPTDWVVYGRKSKRYVIKDDSFKEFFENVAGQNDT